MQQSMFLGQTLDQSLKQSRRPHGIKKLLLGLLLATTALTACTPSHAIGPGADAKNDPDSCPTPTPITETLPVSGAPIQSISMDGSCFKEGLTYEFNGVSLEIKGDVPAGATINGNGGQLIVDGNVGDGARLNVSVPENVHFVPLVYPCGKSICTTIIPYEDGPKAPFDKDPVIIVKGNVGKDVSMNGSYRTTIVKPPAR